MEEERVSDLLKFWIQADNFSRNLLNLKNMPNFKNLKLNRKNKSEVETLFKQWQNDAMIIYDKSVSTIFVF